MYTPKSVYRFVLILMLYQYMVKISLGLAISAFPIGFATIQNTYIALINLVPVAIYLLATRNFHILPVNGLGVKNILLILGMSLSVLPTISVISTVSSIAYDNYSGLLIFELISDSFAVAFITMVIMPAVSEELLFRGLLFSLFGSDKIKQAAVVNGLFFGLMHMNLNQFFYAFVMGVWFVYLVHYTRSIYAPILAHGVLNGSQTLLGLLLRPYMLDEVALSTRTTVGEALHFILQSLPLLVISIPCFFYLFKLFRQHNKPYATPIAEPAVPHRVVTWELVVIVVFFLIVVL